MVKLISASPFKSGSSCFNDKRKIFVFQGSYREIGMQFAASLASTEILNQARAFINKLSPGCKREHTEKVKISLDVAEETIPSWMEMFRGFCDVHKSFSWLEIATANLLPLFAHDRQGDHSCSSIACQINGQLILGQNLDLGATNKTALALIIPEDGPATIQHVSPGYLWFTVGINQYGVVVLGSSVNTDPACSDTSGPLPHALLGFYVLSKANTVEMATSLLRRAPLFGPCGDGSNLILADRHNNMKRMEIAGRLVSEDENDIALITTNHFTTSEMQSLNRMDNSDIINLYRCSLARHTYALEIVRSGKLVSTADMISLLRTSGRVEHWRRFAIPPDVGYTTASYLIDFAKGELSYWSGVSSTQMTGSLPLTLLQDRGVLDGELVT